MPDTALSRCWQITPLLYPTVLQSKYLSTVYLSARGFTGHRAVRSYFNRPLAGRHGRMQMHTPHTCIGYIIMCNNTVCAPSTTAGSCIIYPCSQAALTANARVRRHGTPVSLYMCADKTGCAVAPWLWYRVCGRMWLTYEPGTKGGRRKGKPPGDRGRPHCAVTVLYSPDLTPGVISLAMATRLLLLHLLVVLVSSEQARCRIQRCP